MAGTNIYGELVRAQAQNTTSDLTTPVVGLFYFNTATPAMRWYTGAAWVSAADLTSAQTFTNKTLTSPAISNGLFSEIASPATPASGFVSLYAKTDKKMYTKDSTGVETQLGAGSGSGEINTVESPNDANGWVASGAGITVATSSTASDLPLGPVVDTAIKITPVSGTDYAYYRFTIPAALKNRKLKLEWHQRPLSGYTSGDIKVEVYQNAASNYGGAYTEFTLSTDVSGIASVPNYTGKFTTYLDSDTSDYYEIRFVRVAGTTALNIAGVVFGPGIQAQGAVVSGTGTYNAVVTGLGAGGVTSSKVVYERVGNKLVMSGYIVKDGTPGSGAQAVEVSLPPGLNTDTTAIATNIGQAANFGFFNAYQASASGRVTMNTLTGTIAFMRTVSAVLFSGANFAANNTLEFECEIPIAEWAGSGTVNLAQNDVEYASNSSTSTTTSDTTSFAYGPSGSVIQNITSELDRRVRFQTPIGATDVITVEVSSDRVIWHTLSAQINPFVGTNLSALRYENGVYYGLGLGNIFSSTEVTIKFGQYQFNASTYGAVGQPWSNGAGSGYWRVKKEKAGTAVGFGLATSAQAGLVTLPGSQVVSTSGTGHGSTATKVRRFATNVTTGTGITCSGNDTVNGTTYTINESGVYAMSYVDRQSGAAAYIGITINSSSLTTDIDAVPAAQVLHQIFSGASNARAQVCVPGYRLVAGDVIRPQDNGLMDESAYSKFIITQIAKL